MKTQVKVQAAELHGQRETTIEALKAAIIGILSFAFGGAKIFSSISPFSAAFVACLPIKHAVTAAIGSVIGALLFTRNGYSGFYVTAILLVLAVKIIISRLTKLKIKPAFRSIIALSAMAFCTIFYNLVNDVNFVELFLMIIEVMLCGCLCYFFSISSDALLQKKQNPLMSYVQLTSVAISFICALCAFSAYSIFNINLGVIIGVLSVYILMCRFGILGASVGAIIVAIALNLYSIEMLEFSGMLIISSFIAGAFSPLKKFGQISAFIMMSAFCLLLMGAPTNLTYRLIDIFIATAIFVIIPNRIMMLIDSGNTMQTQAKNSLTPRVMQSGISSKLDYAADTMKDLQAELETISAKFNDIDYNNINGVCDFAANTVCKGCSCALNCWDSCYSETVDWFNPIIQNLKVNNLIDEESMPSYFTKKCCKLEKLIAAINTYYSTFLSKQNSRRQVSEARRMVYEQFNSMADMLCEVSEEISQVNNYDEAISRDVMKAFSKLEAAPLQVVTAVDRYGRTTVEIYTDNFIKTSGSVLCEAISNAANKLFDLPSITTVGFKTKLAFFEKANYTIDFSVQQACYLENQICGDSYEYFTDSKGYAYLLLSDGMGNGKRAAIDSVMTCSLMSRLIKAGFGIDSTIKLINSSLLVKSTDESLSTIDMAKIDLYTGEVEFLKAGAATSFVEVNEQVSRIEATSLPIGIIQGVECERRTAVLKDGDTLVLVSDGATSCSDGYIIDEIKRNGNKSAKELSVRLCQEAKRHVTEHQDDITIIVAKLRKGV